MATILEVGAGKTYETINAAVNAAKSIDGKVEIVISGGEYTENVSFGGRIFVEDGKTYVGGITFKAAEGEYVRINGYFQCNGVAGDMKDIVFDGLTITNTVRNGGYFAPIMLGDNYTNKNASGIEISNCVLNSSTGTSAGTASGIALAMTLKCDGVTITNNTINADCGVYGGDGNLISNTEISNNIITGNLTVPSYDYWGMVYIFNSGAGNVISGNTIDNSALCAVRIRKGAGVVLSGNTITGCSDYNNGGIVQLSAGSVADRNTIDGEVLTYPAYNGSELFVCSGLAGATGELVIIDGMAHVVGDTVSSSFLYMLNKKSPASGKINVIGNVTEDIPAENMIVSVSKDLEIAGSGEVITLNNGGYKVLLFEAAEGAEDIDIKISGVQIVAPKTQVFFGSTVTAEDNTITPVPVKVEIAADSVVSAYIVKVEDGSTVNVLEGGKFFSTGEVMNITGTLTAAGKETFDSSSETLTADDRQVVAHYMWNYGTVELKDTYATAYSQMRLIGADSVFTADNALIEVGRKVDGTWMGNPAANGVGWVDVDGTMNLTNNTVFKANGAPGKNGYGLTVDAGAEVNIESGAFAEISAGVKNNGVINVEDGTLKVGTEFTAPGTQPPATDLAGEGVVNVSGTSTLEVENFTGGKINVADGTTLKDTVIAGKGTVSFAKDGVISFEGKNEINATLANNSGYDLVINKNAELTITRDLFVWGYNRNITVNGVIEDATMLETLDGVQCSLQAVNADGGFSIGGTGTHELVVNDAYVNLGKSSWKNAQGTYTWNFNNSYLQVVNFADTKAGASDTASWVTTFDDSVLAASSHFKSGKGMTINFTNGSVGIAKGSMRMDGVLNIDETSSVEVQGYFNAGAAGAASEHSDILGTLNIAGSMKIKGGSAADVELIGGEININGGNLDLTNNNGSVNNIVMDADSALNVAGTLTAGKITNAGIVNVKDVNSEFNAVNLDNAGQFNVNNGSKLTVTGTVTNTGTFAVKNGATLSVDGMTYINLESQVNINNATYEAGNITNYGKISLAGANFSADTVSGSGTFTIGAGETSLQINSLQQDVRANENSAEAIKLTGNIGTTNKFRVYGDATLDSFNVNADYTGKTVSASGQVLTYGNTVISGNSTMNLNYFQATGSLLLESGSTIKTANINIYDMQENSDFVVQGNIEACTFIVFNDYYNPGSGSEVIIDKGGVLTGLTQNGNGRFDIQSGNMTVYGTVNSDWAAGGGTAYIGNSKLAASLTVDGTYAASDNSNGSFINSGSQKLLIGADGVVNVVNGGLLDWNGAVDNKGTVAIDNASSIIVGGAFNGAAGAVNISISEGTYGKWLSIDAAEGSEFFGTVTVDGISNGGCYIDKANGDLWAYNTEATNIYIDSAWAGYDDYTVVGDDEVFQLKGVNAFGSLDYTADDRAIYLNIAGGTYSQAEGDYSNDTTVIRGGITSITANGEVVVDKGNLVFASDKVGVITITGNFTTTDYIRYTGTWGIDWTELQNGHIRFVGGDKTTFKIDGVFTSGENIQFIGGNAVISENSVLSNNPTHWGQYLISGANVVNYGQMSLDLDGVNGSAMNILKGGKLTVSGEKASLSINMQDGGVTTNKDINVTDGALIAEKGANINATGIVTVSANGAVSVNGANFDAAAVNNSGAFDVTGESNIYIGALTGNVDITDGSVSGLVVDGTVNVYGKSDIDMKKIGGNIVFGSLEKAVDAKVDGVGFYDVDFYAQNGKVEITGKMDEGSFGVMNIGNGKTESEKDTAASVAVNVAKDALVQADKVVIAENAKAEQTLNVYGELNANTVFASENGVLNVENGSVYAETIANSGKVSVVNASMAADVMANNAQLKVNGSTVKFSRFDNNGYADITSGKVFADSAVNSGNVKVNSGSILFGELDTAKGSFDVTGGSYLKIDSLTGAVNVNEATVTGSVVDGTINVYGKSDIDMEKVGGEMSFGSQDKAVDAKVNAAVVNKVDFYAQNGNVELNGNMEENSFVNMNVGAGETSAAVNIAKDADINAQKVVVGENAKVEQALNVYGKLDADTVFTSGMGALNVNGGKIDVETVVNTGKVSMTKAEATINVMDNDAQLKINGSSAAFGSLDNSGYIDVTSGKAFADSAVNTGDIKVNSATILFGELDNEAGSFDVTGGSHLEIGKLTGEINAHEAVLTGSVTGGTLNVTGKSAVKLTDGLDKAVFGSMDKTVDAEVDVTGWNQVEFIAQNGTVNITGKTEGNGLYPMKVGGFYKTGHESEIPEQGEAAMGSTTVNITDYAYVKANQVYIAENSALKEHTLNVAGELDAKSIYNKALGNLNVTGKVSTTYLQAAGDVTVSGENAQMLLTEINAGNGAAKIGTDEAGLRSQFKVEDGATVAAVGNVYVGYNGDRNGDLLIDGANFSADKVTVQEGSTAVVTGASTLNIGALTGTFTVENADLTASSINKGTVTFKGNNTFEGDFNASLAFVGDWGGRDYDGSVNFGTDSSVNVGAQMIIGRDSTVAGANNVVFGDVTGATITDKVFNAADVSVRRDGTLTIANTTGVNKINTMNVMGSVVIDNALLTGEVQIGNSSADIDAVMTVKNGAVVTLGGSQNSQVVLGKSNGGILNIDDATVHVQRCGSGGSYTVVADMFVIGYNGGVGEMNLTNGATFTTGSGNNYATGVMVSSESSINMSGKSQITIAGDLVNDGSIYLTGYDTITVNGILSVGGIITIDLSMFSGVEKKIIDLDGAFDWVEGTNIQFIGKDEHTTIYWGSEDDGNAGDIIVTRIDTTTLLVDKDFANADVYEEVEPGWIKDGNAFADISDLVWYDKTEGVILRDGAYDDFTVERDKAVDLATDAAEGTVVELNTNINSNATVKDIYAVTGSINVGENGALAVTGKLDVNGGIANAGDMIFGDGADVSADKLENLGSVAISGNVTVNTEIFGEGSVSMAGGTVLSGDLSAEKIAIGEGGAALAGSANLKAALTGGSLTVSGADNKLQLQEGSDSALIVDSTVVFDKEDMLDDVVIKGANDNTVITVADKALNGNTLDGVKLNITDLEDDGVIRVYTDIDNILKIGDYLLTHEGGIHYFTVEGEKGDKVIYVAKDAQGVLVTDGVGNNVTAEEEYKAFTITEDSTLLAYVNVYMTAGKTAVTVKNGKKAKDGSVDTMTFAIGGILKNTELGGSNTIKFGDYNDITVNGNIESLASMTLGKNSKLYIAGDVVAQNTNSTIKIGANSNVVVDGDIMLAGGKNKVSIATVSNVTFGSVADVVDFKIAAGKKDSYTNVTITGKFDAPAMNNKLTIGNYVNFSIGQIDGVSIDNGGVSSGTGTTVKVGTASTMNVEGSANGIAAITTGKESKVAFGDITGTDKNNKISVGANADFTAGDINLAYGKNTITTGKGADTGFAAGAISNVQIINVGGQSSFTADSITGVNKFTVNDGKAAAKKAAAVLTEAAVNGDVVMTDGKDTFKVGANSNVDIAGGIVFGDGKDTLSMGKNSRLTVAELNAAADLEVFNAAAGAVVAVANGKDNDLDLTGVTGSWSKATLIDGEGMLEAANDGMVYSNEFDCYTFELAAGESLTFENISKGTDIKYSYMVDGEWTVAQDYTGSLTEASEYRIFVGVDSDSFSKKDEKLSYSFDVKLA